MRRKHALRRRYGRAHVKSRMPDMSWLYGGATGSLHERAAAALGWPVRDTQSMSLHALRELVRPVNPGLANEISMAIESGSYIRGGRR